MCVCVWRRSPSCFFLNFHFFSCPVVTLSSTSYSSSSSSSSSFCFVLLVLHQWRLDERTPFRGCRFQYENRSDLISRWRRDETTAEGKQGERGRRRRVVGPRATERPIAAPHRVFRFILFPEWEKKKNRVCPVAVGNFFPQFSLSVPRGLHDWIPSLYNRILLRLLLNLTGLIESFSEECTWNFHGILLTLHVENFCCSNGADPDLKKKTANDGRESGRLPEMVNDVDLPTARLFERNILHAFK